MRVLCLLLLPQERRVLLNSPLRCLHIFRHHQAARDPPRAPRPLLIVGRPASALPAPSRSGERRRAIRAACLGQLRQHSPPPEQVDRHPIAQRLLLPPPPSLVPTGSSGRISPFEARTAPASPSSPSCARDLQRLASYQLLDSSGAMHRRPRSPPPRGYSPPRGSYAPRWHSPPPDLRRRSPPRYLDLPPRGMGGPPPGVQQLHGLGSWLGGARAPRPGQRAVWRARRQHRGVP